MALATLDPTLLKVPAGTWNMLPFDPLARSDMDQGPARVRRRFTTSPSFIQFNGILETDKFLRFSIFYFTTIHAGADWFTMTVWNGHDMGPRTVRFVEHYKATDGPVPGWMTLSFSLEVKDLIPVPTGTVLWTLETYGQDVFYDFFLDRLQRIVNDPKASEHPSFSKPLT